MAFLAATPNNAPAAADVPKSAPCVMIVITAPPDAPTAASTDQLFHLALSPKVIFPDRSSLSFINLAKPDRCVESTFATSSASLAS